MKQIFLLLLLNAITISCVAMEKRLELSGYTSLGVSSDDEQQPLIHNPEKVGRKKFCKRFWWLFPAPPLTIAGTLLITLSEHGTSLRTAGWSIFGTGMALGFVWMAANYKWAEQERLKQLAIIIAQEEANE